MEENSTTDINPETGIEELSHSDKIVGVLTEPAATFEKTAKFPLKTVDWFLPIILVLIISVISQFIIFSNPEINYQMIEKQKTATEKMVQEGKITQEQADKQAQFMSGSTMVIIRSVSTLIFGFIVYLIIAGIHFLFCKFALKGEGNYVSALVANGLTGYIVMIQIIITTILSLVFGKLLSDVSVTSLIGMDKHSFVGWLLSFVDVITIWAFIVLSIGLAKMFKSKSTGKYYVLVFGLWFVWKLLIFGLGNAVPFLKNF